MLKRGYVDVGITVGFALLAQCAMIQICTVALWYTYSKYVDAEMGTQMFLLMHTDGQAHGRRATTRHQPAPQHY